MKKAKIQFHQEYPELFAIWPPAVAKIGNSSAGATIRSLPVAKIESHSTDDAIWQRAVAKLPWAHNIILIQKVKELPTIGLILCEDKNKIVAEYALRGMDKAIGVSAYELTRALPKKLQSALPSIEQLEAELSQTRSSKPATAAKEANQIATPEDGGMKHSYDRSCLPGRTSRPAAT